MTFRMKQPPAIPTKSQKRIQHSLYDGCSIMNILKQFPQNQWDKVQFDVQSAYYEGYDYYLYAYVEEEDEEYAKKMKKYLQEVEEHNKWLEDNKEEIENRKKKQQEKHLKALMTRQKNLEAELAKVNNQLKLKDKK